MRDKMVLPVMSPSIRKKLEDLIVGKRTVQLLDNWSDATIRGVIYHVVQTPLYAVYAIPAHTQDA
jgi:hypothetical protein